MSSVEQKKFNHGAAFSDGCSQYRIPMEPDLGDEVRIRLRTARDNADEAVAVVDGVETAMKLERSDDYFDYYYTVIKADRKSILYYFKIKSGNEIWYYDKTGVNDRSKPEYFYQIVPGFKTPDWAKGAVFYQIFTDRFFNGDFSNDVETGEYNYIGAHSVQVNDWNKFPDTMDVRHFYGGDLRGILKKLDYLEELGVEAIYLNPIFVSPSNHKYDCQDYDYIDPHYGVILNDGGECLAPGDDDNRNATKLKARVADIKNLEASNAFFAKFVEAVHARGIKVILDGVFNHCGSFNKWLDKERIYENAEGFDKGAYISKDSPYIDYFKFHENTEDKWPCNNSYDGWWGHDTLPKLNYEGSEKLFDYIMHIGRKWVSPPYNADGWRLDVAADLGHSQEYNHYFWKEFRKNVREANPEAIILAEHYGDPGAWLQGDEWDTVMNYDAFMEPITWFLTGVEKHSDEYREDLYNNPDVFWGSMKHYMARFNSQSLLVAMNELSNHDHSRFLTRTNHRAGRLATAGPYAAGEGINPAIMRIAVLMQMTWPGAPTVYYGDEAGVCGWTDPDNRRTYPWGNEDKEMIAFHKEMIKIHKAYPALRTGSIKFLAGSYGVISYARFDETDSFITIVNNNDYDVNVEVPVWQAGFGSEIPLIRMVRTNQEGFSVDMTTYVSDNGMLRIKMSAHSAVLVKNFPTELFSMEPLKIYY